MKPPTLFDGIDLWRRMSVKTRTAFVQWLAADTSVKLYTQEEVDALMIAQIDKSAADHEALTEAAIRGMKDTMLVDWDGKYDQLTARILAEFSGEAQ